MQPQGKRRVRRTPYMSIFPTKILLATDGSREAQLAATTAADLAKSTGSELHVLHVGEAANPYAEGVGLAGAEAAVPRLEGEPKGGEFERLARDVLDAEADRVRSAGGAVAQAHLSKGKVDHEVVTFAEEIGAGLIVLGSRGWGGIRRALMGSVSDSVVRHSHCPVLVVREGRDTAP
jgi:nucleotide-binding universal stress UspA family protein